jgi:UDP-N-acetylglucosamine 3-dehydrogenase
VTLNVGIVGTGNIFERGYAPAFEQTSELRIAALYDPIATRLDAAADRFRDATRAGSLDELLALDGIDAVFVLTPTHTHADLAIAALETGHHVLCEKPMARTPVDARRMAAAAVETGRRLMIGHTRRFDDRWLALRDQLASGRIGDPVYMFRSEQAFNGAPGDAWSWQDAQSGGVLWDVGVHVAEMFHWFLGTVPENAYTREIHSRDESRAGGAPDVAVVTFDFGRARHAMMSVSWMHPAGWGPGYATTEIVGTGGRLEYHDLDGHPATIIGATTEVPRYSPLLSAQANTFRAEIEHFARAIERGDPFAITVDDAIVAVDMVDAAERSAASGRPEAVAR